MTVGLSSYVANGWLNQLRGVAFTAPAAVYAKLHIGDPGAAGTANPSAVTTRVAITYSAASGGSISITGTAPSWAMTATEVLSHVSFHDATSGGNFLWSAALTSTKSVGAGDTYTLSTENVNLAAIAA